MEIGQGSVKGTRLGFIFAILLTCLLELTSTSQADRFHYSPLGASVSRSVSASGRKCPPGYSLVRKPEGDKCLKDFSRLWGGPATRSPRPKAIWGAQSPDTFGFGRPTTPLSQPVTTPRQEREQERQQQQQQQDQRPPPQQFGFFFDPPADYVDEEDERELERELQREQDINYMSQRYSTLEDELALAKKSRAHQLQKGRGTAYPLPHPDHISRQEEHCLQDKSVFWPKDQQCYQLMHRGPCHDSEWLVLQEKPFSRDQIEITCQRRPCPCSPRDPMLCEVWYEASAGGRQGCSKCQVALAAEQDGLCGRGEQLLVDPFGRGMCGCRQEPVHLRWPADNTCYPLYTQGPCPDNQTLQFSPTENKPVCVPVLCPAGMVLHPGDGRCYHLGSRGPCDEFSKLVLNRDRSDPVCQLAKSHQVKRIFDMAPNHLRDERERNNILGNLRVQMTRSCGLDNRGSACFQQQRRSEQKKRRDRQSISSLFPSSVSKKDGRDRNSGSMKAKNYLLWLRSFRQN